MKKPAPRVCRHEAATCVRRDTRAPHGGRQATAKKRSVIPQKIALAHGSDRLENRVEVLEIYSRVRAKRQSSSSGIPRVSDSVHNAFMTNSKVPGWIQAARGHWRWRGVERPPFAQAPKSGQESVWDYPRPPQLKSDSREVVVRWGTAEVARTRRAIRVLETSHPPSFYLPLEDVAQSLLIRAPGSSFCEWKGPAQYWSLVDGERRLANVAWSYPSPLAGAEALAKCIAFYPTDLDCRVDGAEVLPQPGGFYGGWITPEVTGPFKGEPGSEGW